MTTYGTFKEIQMNMDMVDFQRSENLDNDYEIKSSFPVEVEYHLRHLIEYRIKLLLKDRVVIEPGESKLVETAWGASKLVLDINKDKNKINKKKIG